MPKKKEFYHNWLQPFISMDFIKKSSYLQINFSEKKTQYFGSFKKYWG